MTTQLKTDNMQYLKILEDLGSYESIDHRTIPGVFTLDVGRSQGQEADWLSMFYLSNCLSGWTSYEEQIKRIWDTFQNRVYSAPVASVSTDDIVDFGYTNILFKSIYENALSCVFEKETDDETRYDLEVVKRFKSIGEVEAIYVDLYLGRKRYQILTSNSKYDDELMDRLLEVELELLNLSKDNPASFEYVPHIYDETNEVISINAKYLYKRGYNVILSSTFVASEQERETGAAII